MENQEKENRDVIINNIIVNNTNTTQKKSRTKAFLLALFLGWFGAHKFYCNKPGMGLIYLLFCFTYIPAIISVVEAILYIICDSDEEFTEKYVGR